ncbi:MAG: hypothetical protein K2X87_27680 [Gemmataceae bacterium]|nr:hypothetical protein [Gemmataceae bacterium]
MRLAFLLLAAGALLPAGCSCLVASAGKEPVAFTTREQVRAEFGRPTATGEEAGRFYEEYVTRRKLAEPLLLANGMLMASYCTFGLAEAALFPLTIYETGRGFVVGRRLRYEYDESGKVRAVKLDGGTLLHAAPFAEPAPSQPPVP